MEANEVRVLKKILIKSQGCGLNWSLICDVNTESMEGGSCSSSASWATIVVSELKRAACYCPPSPLGEVIVQIHWVFFHLLITNGYFSPLIHLIWFAASGAIALNVLLGTMADDVAAAASSCHHLSLLPDVFSCGPAKVVFTLHGCSA